MRIIRKTTTISGDISGMFFIEYTTSIYRYILGFRLLVHRYKLKIISYCHITVKKWTKLW